MLDQNISNFKKCFEHRVDNYGKCELKTLSPTIAKKLHYAN